MRKLVLSILLSFSVGTLAATSTSDYQAIGKVQVQGDSGDVYLRLPNDEEWFTNCPIAYLNGSMAHSDKMYSAALAAKMSSKKVAMVGECINGYFHASQLFIE